MKRLRKKYGSGIRVFYCGEYGDHGGTREVNPHYHALLFNHYFPDMQYWKTENENDYFISPSLEKLWPFGFSSVGAATFQSAAYVARYIVKKITGKDRYDHYKTDLVDPRTGEVFTMMREPEFARGSQDPAIGGDWFKYFSTDVFPDDFVVVDGKQMKPPRYYDNLLKEVDPKGFKKMQQKRKAFAALTADNNTPDRLKVREMVKSSQLSALRREL